jgi:hypothetical protein
MLSGFSILSSDTFREFARDGSHQIGGTSDSHQRQTGRRHPDRVRGKIKRASFDRAFHTPDNQEKLATIVDHPCIPKKGRDSGRKQQEAASVEFREARKNHPGIESAIGALQAGNGQECCREKSKLGYDRYVGLGILGRNLQVLGKLLLAQDATECEAAQSKRKPPASQ